MASKKPKIESLPVESIEATAATQVRKRLDKDTIEQYREDLENGDQFPAIIVFREKNSKRTVLADGFHRLLAHIHAEKETIDCEIHEGDIHAALQYALGANAQHGLRRTKQDKRNAVELALKDPEISSLERQEIADLCRVHVRTVYKIQRELNIGDEPATEKPKKPEKAKPEDNRPSAKPEPTQEEVELEELRQACSLIKAFPYGGEDSTKLELTPDDVADLEYVSTWTAAAVIVARKK